MYRIDPQTEAAAQRFLSLINDHYDLAGAIVYGSRARGTHHADSDADLAVLLRGKQQRFLPTLLAMSDTAFDVLDVNDADGACNRAYYAMFDAARAALMLESTALNRDSGKTHGGLLNAFSSIT